MLGGRAQIDLWAFVGPFLLVIHPTRSKIFREHFTEDSAAPLHSGLAGLCLPNVAP